MKITIIFVSLLTFLFAHLAGALPARDVGSPSTVSQIIVSPQPTPASQIIVSPRQIIVSPKPTPANRIIVSPRQIIVSPLPTPVNHNHRSIIEPTPGAHSMKKILNGTCNNPTTTCIAYDGLDSWQVECPSTERCVRGTCKIDTVRVTASC
ncbi:hypothetical protein BDV23DRAFT_182777 [Aspergillus alliaceus]|uniref:Uncharacterized protein n=1 Tax=Petromyces alliaceus TaxID=209559 RepID=A0A5N7CCE2_PETAA|nr:hypothetical protein BDV23DRAFT_182777 [Aspergillus alliaceus]